MNNSLKINGNTKRIHIFIPLGAFSSVKNAEMERKRQLEAAKRSKELASKYQMTSRSLEMVRKLNLIMIVINKLNRQALELRKEKWMLICIVLEK